MKKKRRSKNRRTSRRIQSMRHVGLLVLVTVLLVAGVVFSSVYQHELRAIAFLLIALFAIVVVGTGFFFGYLFVSRVVDVVVRGVNHYVRVRPYQSAGLQQLHALPASDFVRLVTMLYEGQGYRVIPNDDTTSVIDVYLKKGNEIRALAIRSFAPSRAVTHMEVAAVRGMSARMPTVLVTRGHATREARRFAHTHGVDLTEGAALMRMLWHRSPAGYSMFRFSIVRALFSPALTIPDRAVPTHVLRVYQRTIKTWSPSSEVAQHARGCEKFWPELCSH